ILGVDEKPCLRLIAVADPIGRPTVHRYGVVRNLVGTADDGAGKLRQQERGRRRAPIRKRLSRKPKPAVHVGSNEDRWQLGWTLHDPLPPISSAPDTGECPCGARNRTEVLLRLQRSTMYSEGFVYPRTGPMRRLHSVRGSTACVEAAPSKSHSIRGGEDVHSIDYVGCRRAGVNRYRFSSNTHAYRSGAPGRGHSGRRLSPGDSDRPCAPPI